jgi:hypothetical protein
MIHLLILFFAFFCRIVEIDCHQRVTMAKEHGEILRVKVPYGQIKPHLTSDLHKPLPSPDPNQETTPAVDHLSENQKKQPETKPELNHHQPTKPPPSMGQNSAPSTALEHDVIVTCQKRPKKRKNGPLPVKPATFSDGCKVQPIKNGEWLTDEHVDNAQAILAQHFPYIGGLQAVWVFISEGCQ